MFEFEAVKNTDREIYDSMMRELGRQEHNIELIASENFVSPAVMQAMGSHLTNKYAEGYPGKRYYGGCQFVDEAEELARERAKKLFGEDGACQRSARIRGRRPIRRSISVCSSRAIRFSE